jgi:hypothetical protein
MRKPAACLTLLLAGAAVAHAEGMPVNADKIEWARPRRRSRRARRSP